MLIAFLIVSMLIGLFLSIASDAFDMTTIALKVFFIGYTICSGILLLGAVWPYINNGQIRLF